MYICIFVFIIYRQIYLKEIHMHICMYSYTHIYKQGQKDCLSANQLSSSAELHKTFNIMQSTKWLPNWILMNCFTIGGRFEGKQKSKFKTTLHLLLVFKSVSPTTLGSFPFRGKGLERELWSVFVGKQGGAAEMPLSTFSTRRKGPQHSCCF